MRKFEKTITAIIVIIAIITNVFLNCSKVYANASLNQVEQRPVRAAVLLRTGDDPYTLLLKQSFEEIQKKNEGKIEFTFYDCKNSQLIQNQNLDLVLQKGNVDIVLLNLASTEGSQYIINKVKEKNIPVGLFNIEPPNINSVRSYNKAYFVGTKPEEAGILQGKILINAWNKDKVLIDRNRDNIMQYVMLMGPPKNLEAIGRTKYSVLTVNDAGIQTQEIASRVCNWKEDLAREAMEQIFLQNGDKIEVIISNNDAMAIGAIEILQKYGYNKGDKNKTITVVGVDAIPEAQELIKKGYMTGSVLQDAYSMAEATYEIGMNLVHGRPPLEGTPYKFDDTGVSVRIPYKEYIANIQ
ncbi:galactose ABC transporter substrate-binding protein [Clostridium sp.]|uniref:galactose ABC transporter substrate-binding protein n=1 Tax=Clostridium sp. TaxID=1506 RepID=UPI00262F2F78|nr:galactose ABC transporter substrate-binding protein [Clostridium sp.]